MKKIIVSFIILFLCTILLNACINSKNNKLIIGNWKAVSWLENGTPNLSKSENTEFGFDEKNQYSFSHDGVVKKGTYKVENNLLFTT